MTFTIPSDAQLIALYKAVASILNTEGVSTPTDEEAVAFIAHYGTVARLTLGTVLSLVDRFKTKHKAEIPAPAPAPAVPAGTPPIPTP